MKLSHHRVRMLELVGRSFRIERAQLKLAPTSPFSRGRCVYRLPLEPHQLFDSLLPQLEQTVHLFARERRALGRPLEFDEAAIAGANDIHVNFGAGIFVVFEIEQRRPVNNSDADRGNFADDGRFIDLLFVHQSFAGNREGHIRAGNCCGAGAAVSLKHVTVEGNRPFTQSPAVGDRAQAAANQSLNFVGTA